MEPEIRAIVGAEPVASLSPSYSDMLIDGLNPVLYPVVLRYSAYTPYLDKLNANWIRERGPRFLLFNGGSIDNRHPWIETPGMWVEIYRWYNLRFLGPRNLLLERRGVPRFTRFEPVAHAQVQWGEELRPPASSDPVFWTMQCSLSKTGRLRQLLVRIPEVTLELGQGNGQNTGFRVVPALLGSPSMGNYLPSTLAEFASVFNAGTPGFQVGKFRFGGPGASAYAPTCELQWLRPE